MGERDHSRRFIRVLRPVAPWTPEGQRDARVAGFRHSGTISIYEVSDALQPIDVLAVYYGSTTRPLPVEVAYFPFDEHEIEAAGGKLESTDSDPDWPENYTEAHHDIVEAMDEVSSHMVDLYEESPDERKVVLDQEALLARIFSLAGRSGIPKRIQKNLEKRAERLSREDRALWERLVEQDGNVQTMTNAVLERKEEEAKRQVKRKKRTKG